MFPPTWHQLTLHCGWQGPSAGGPYHLPPPEPTFGGGGAASSAAERSGGEASSTNGGAAAQLVSSTWCCNPQFRMTVKKAAEVVVCLGQQDPTVAHRCHVPKRHRKRAIGLQVGRRRVCCECFWW